MSLRSLSDSEILSRTHKLVQQERDVTLLILLHLNEIERRKLHLKLGYSSLFDYCTSKLGYSASAAVRRIKTARCIVRVPRTYELLKRSEANLSTIAQVSDALTEANHDDLLARIRGRSQREVEAILAEYQPCRMPRDRMRTIVVRVPASQGRRNEGASSSTAAPDHGALPLLSADRCEKSAYDRNSRDHVFATSDSGNDTCENSDYNRNGCEPVKEGTEEPARAAECQPTEKRVMFQFSVRPEFMEKLEKIRSFAWHRLPANSSLENFFELVMDLVIAREDPTKRVERRERRTERATEGKRQTPGSASKGSGRHIPARVRDKVFIRDGHRCMLVGAGGRRCKATRALQVDHVTPIARGGASTADNLRLLCAYPNRLEAERLLGSTAGHIRSRSSPLGLGT